MTWTITNPPAPDADALSAFRTQVRESSTQFDTELTAKLNAAMGELQENAAIQYHQAQATYRADSFDDWYKWGYDTYINQHRPRFLLPPSPLVSVESVTYVDTDGNNQTLDPADYEVITDTRPGFIRPAWDKSWPAARSVLVSYTVGWGPWASVPGRQQEGALEYGERLYRGQMPDTDDLRRLYSMVSVGDDFARYPR